MLLKNMSQVTDNLLAQIRELPDEEKLHLVDAILTDLYEPDPDIERIWADEARKRWEAYKAGKLSTVSYDEVMAKHRR
jgi:putative addiction module component (TIGR02574 family)